MTRHHTISALLLVPALAGCPALDVIEGKPSPYKAAHEQRMALVTPVVASVAEPVIEPVAFVEPEPTCEIIWRVQNCDGNNPIPWSM